MGAACAGVSARVESRIATQEICQPCTSQLQRWAEDEACMLPPGCLQVYTGGSPAEAGGLQPTGPIKKPELRGLSAKELETILDMIGERCSQENWLTLKGDAVGSRLSPQSVTMHELNHYIILPETVPEGVVLRGLDTSVIATSGLPVVQRDDFGTSHPWGRAELKGTALGEGMVRPTSNSNSNKGLGASKDVEVKVLRGRFVSALGAAEKTNVVVGNTDCGAPAAVTYPISMSWKERMSPILCKPEWFVSHCWGAPVFALLRCLLAHARLRHAEDEAKGPLASYWICAFCANQHYLQGQRWAEPNLTIMRSIISLCKGLVVVVDHKASAFTRLWCQAEVAEFLSQADTKSFGGLRDNGPKRYLDVAGMNGQGEASVFVDGQLEDESFARKTAREASFDVKLMLPGLKSIVEGGAVSFHEDRICLLNWMRNHTPYMDTDVEDMLEADKVLYNPINTALKSTYARLLWPAAIRAGHRRGALDGVTLPAILKEDRMRQHMMLSFVNVREFTGIEYSNLASALPASLVSLRLHLQGCPVDNLGLCAMALALPKTIEYLQLEHGHADGITDEALSVLASNLPSGLQELALGFPGCGGKKGGISLKGVELLMEGISNLQMLRKLFLNIRDISGLSESVIQVVAAGLPRTLEEVQLRFEGIRPINRSLWFKNPREVEAWREDPMQRDTWITRVEKVEAIRTVTRDHLEELCQLTRADYALFWNVVGGVLAVESWVEPQQPADVPTERPEGGQPQGNFGRASSEMRLAMGSGMPGLVHSSQRELVLSGSALRGHDFFERKELAAQYRISAIASVPCGGGVVEYGSRVAWEGFG